MAKSNVQRVSIIIIAVVMLVGTLGFYFVLIMANDQQSNQASQQAELQRQMEEEQKMRQKSLRPLKGYKATAFEASKVTSLQKKDLVVGKGAKVPKGAKVTANYFGWLPDGTIFDGTNIGGSAKPVEFSLKGVIKGWTDGVPGMKVGGIRQLVIPAEQAYGANGSGSIIPPNTPLKFIVEVTRVKS